MARLLNIILLLLIVLIMYIDINKKYIPNFLNLLFMGFCIYSRGISKIEKFIIGAGIYSLPLLIIYGYVSDLLNKEVIGFGDVKLSISLGGLLFKGDYSVIIQVYIFYLLTFLLATLFILFLFIYNFKNRNSKKFRNKELAFSPFLLVSFLTIYFFRSKFL